MPWITTLVFCALAVVAAFAVVSDIRTGETGNSLYTFHLNESPLGYCAILMGKLSVIGIAIAQVGFMLGLNSDPILAIQASLGWLGTGRAPG